MAYLTGVLTDLLHTQRDPLALCLLLQAYDKLEPPLPPCCRQLSWFSRYYSLWIPEPAREALVSCGRRCSRGSQAFPGKARRVLPGAPAGCATAVWLYSRAAYRVKFLSLLIFPAEERRLRAVTAAQLMCLRHRARGATESHFPPAA